MNKEIIAVLEAQKPQTLGEWWKELNSWGWVTELGEPELAEHHELGHRTAIMTWIEDEIGFKECLRAWNKLRMDDATFEEFWRTGPGKRHQDTDGVLDAEVIG